MLNKMGLAVSWGSLVGIVLTAIGGLLTLIVEPTAQIRGFFYVLTICIFVWFLCKWKYLNEVNALMGIINDESPIARETIPFHVRKFVLQRDGYKCVWCNRKGTKSKDGNGETWQIDHLIPCTKGGRTIPSNLATTCRICNNVKSNKTPIEYLHYMKRKHN